MGSLPVNQCVIFHGCDQCFNFHSLVWHAFSALMPSVLWHCWLGGRKGIRPVKIWADGGGWHWLVRIEWCPAGWSVCLRLLIFPCTIKSRSSLLAPAHLGGPRKKAVKRMCVVWHGRLGDRKGGQPLIPTGSLPAKVEAQLWPPGKQLLSHNGSSSGGTGTDLECPDKSKHREVMIQKYVQNKVERFSAELEWKVVV